jgi:hypothetical protein
MKFKTTNICNLKGCHFGSVDRQSKLKVRWNLQLLNYKSVSLGIIAFWEQFNPPHWHSRLGLIQQKSKQMINTNMCKTEPPTLMAGQCQVLYNLQHFCGQYVNTF